MFKFAAVIFAIIACASAKPGFIGAPLAYTASAAVVAAPAPFVTATSSQYVARNYNGVATAPIIAPVATPVVARQFAALAAPVAAAYTAPFAAGYTSPVAAYSAPVIARYAASAPLVHSAPLSYTSPLSYAAAPAPVLW